jgi:hypothetical protein
MATRRKKRIIEILVASDVVRFIRVPLEFKTFALLYDANQ